MLRVRLPLFLVLIVVVCLVPSAGASVASGTITAHSGWSRVATLAPGVTVSRATVTVAGYRGGRTLTRVSWTLGDRHVALDAVPVAPTGYGPAQHSFAEGMVSSYGQLTAALAGINGDTFCAGCAANGNDILHGLLVHDREIYATGSGPEVGYLPGGRMVMGPARAVPVMLSLPNGAVTVAVWNALSIPGRTMYGDQVAVLSRPGARFAIPKSSTALVLTGKVSVYGATSTVGAEFRHMVTMAVPYKDAADTIRGSSGRLEWADAYRISQIGGTPVAVAMPAPLGTVSGTTVTVPTNGVVLVARNATTAAKGLLAAAHHTVAVTLDDKGWNTATSIVDGKYQMVSNGVAHTRYPGWPDSWPWYCQGIGSGCVRAVVAETHTQGWLITETATGGNGLTMPDFARVLAQLGATNAMGFDSNSHADFWRKGASPITAFGHEPTTPEATILHYH
jgi:hypothetical protein